MTGPSFRLAEWLNENWPQKVSMTNQEVAMKMGYKSANIVSMWRTGKTNVALHRLPEIADLMKVDFVTLLPLWIEQYLGDADPSGKSALYMRRVMTAFNRLATVNEYPMLKAVRSVFGRRNPPISPNQIEAIRQVVGNASFTDFVLEEAKKQNLITAIPEVEDEAEPAMPPP